MPDSSVLNSDDDRRERGWLPQIGLALTGFYLVSLIAYL